MVIHDMFDHVEHEIWTFRVIKATSNSALPGYYQLFNITTMSDHEKVSYQKLTAIIIYRWLYQ